jgi:uncharacterized protein with HEPN domain
MMPPSSISSMRLVLIQTFIQDMTKEAFLVDLKTQSAVLHQITVIGEAVKRLSQAFRERHPILP